MVNPKMLAGVKARRANVTAHEYSPETKQLTVTYHNGRRYRYDGVSPNTAANFKAAASRGAFLHTHIIGKHKATEITD